MAHILTERAGVSMSKWLRAEWAEKTGYWCSHFSVAF